MPTPPQTQALRCFVAVAHEGSVSAAAAKLHLTQPAVSLQVKHLEDVTGLMLFHRTPHGLVITKAGAALLAEAERVLAAMADFSRAASSVHASARVTLRIGTILDPEFTRLGAFLRELINRAPHIETHLRHGMSDDVLAQITRRELDVGFYLDLPHGATGAKGTKEKPGKGPALQMKSLLHFTYRVVAPPGWGSRVLGKGWKSLAALPWLATPPASAHQRLLASVFRPLRLQPTRVALTDQEGPMLDLVESGVGLSLIRDSVADRECKARNLVVADRVSIACVLSFICLKARVAEPAIAHAWEAINKAWSRIEQQPP